MDGGEGTENKIFKYNYCTGHDIGNGGTVSIADHYNHNALMYKGGSVVVRLGNDATIEFNELIGQCCGNIQNAGARIQV